MPGGRVLLQQPLGLEGGDQPVGGALAQAEPAAQLGHARAPGRRARRPGARGRRCAPTRAAAIGSVPRPSRCAPPSPIGTRCPAPRDILPRPGDGGHKMRPVHIAWFDRHDPALEPVLGGKNTSLGIMTMAGLPVPAGFAVTAEAYRRALSDTGVDAALARHGQRAGRDRLRGAARVATEARGTITGTPLPAWLADEVDAAYATLSERRGQADLPVAVRSSATCEDQPDASFAGEHDTYLWVRTRRQRPRAPAALLGEPLHRAGDLLPPPDALRRGRRRDERRRPADGDAADVRGRLHPQPAQRRPLPGRDRRLVGARRGRGQRLGHPRQLPGRQGDRRDHLSGPSPTRRSSTSSTATTTSSSARSRTERRTAPCLSDDEVRAVAVLARRAEKHYGKPAGRRVGHRPGPARRRERRAAPVPPGDGLEPQEARRWPRSPATPSASIVHNLLHPSGNQTVHLH